MSNYPDHNFPAFDRYAAFLRNQGHTVISPADLSRTHAVGIEDHRAGLTTAQQYATFIRNDLQALLIANAIALLPGWERSRGARYELLTAQMLGLPVLDADTGLPLDVPRVLTGLWSTSLEVLVTPTNAMVGHDDALVGV